MVINKVDKLNCDPEYTQEAVFDLMFSLGATEDQLDFPTAYGSSKQGWMSDDWKKPTDNISYLLDLILQHIKPPQSPEGNTQMMITSLDYSSYIGRIAVGRLSRGTLIAGQNITLIKRDGRQSKQKVKELYVFEGLGKEKTKDVVQAGDICAIMGLENFDIGDTVADFENPESLIPIAVEEPTMNMFFTANNSPFFGKEGKYVTSRHIHDRLYQELEKNLAMRVQESPNNDGYTVFGRGILHLSILIETMRREGYELQVGQPQVIVKEVNGEKHEPVEYLTIHSPEEFSGKVIELVTMRRGEILTIENRGDRTHMEFSIPSRGIIGLRNNILTATEGEAIMAHRFKEYAPWKGDLGTRRQGALIAKETGTAYAYAIDKLQDRGKFFIEPFDEVYVGQVIGEHIRQEDLVVNVTISKKLTNFRAAGADDKTGIAPAIKFSLEEAMEYIGDDEYLEVTPQSLRLRKILLSEVDRKRALKN